MKSLLASVPVVGGLRRSCEDSATEIFLSGGFCDGSCNGSWCSCYKRCECCFESGDLRQDQMSVGPGHWAGVGDLFIYIAFRSYITRRTHFTWRGCSSTSVQNASRNVEVKGQQRDIRVSSERCWWIREVLRDQGHAERWTTDKRKHRGIREGSAGGIAHAETRGGTQKKRN